MCDAPEPRRLLDWYDTNARDLPWRIGPQACAAGVLPDPYRVWLSEIMLQQTTVAAVTGYFERFTRAWPDVASLAAAADSEVMAAWAGLGYYARARNLLACARALVAGHDCRFPETEAGLRALPGIGPYTSAAIAAIAFDKPSTVVDGNVERVMARVFAVETPLPQAKPELKRLAATLTPQSRPGDYAQAVMDLGATICTPRAPSCAACPWRSVCKARAGGFAADLPRKAPKQARPVRVGRVWLGQRAEDGAWLLERRPQRGLLGGMLGWPGTGWDIGKEGIGISDPPCAGDWQMVSEEVRHTFTHFHLRLQVHSAILPKGTVPLRGQFLEADTFRPGDLPTVMRKAWDLVQK